ncbi:hypothetical protein GCM10018790_28250 [Kitasatospora xanthocidica]|uniref:hypothetical protein n=1 Tax=Kitasatospora xanthocidica TaxID=83382 RepID=UPI0016727E73|nr:hypothetical protein [Kitasatospora xanthocidica]GHF48874.1 hypothetical protein GCM10018790_28250 [Kitasatospora xanthocidica]
MSSGDDTDERNPFAPPPADAPDQPWQPRSPWTGEGQDGGGHGGGGQGGGPGGERPQLPPPWGSGQGDGSPGQRPPAPQPPRLDPANPAHRRARNAALAGPFALVCLFTGFHWIALLVGLLGIVWGIGALRSPKGTPAATAAAAGPFGPVGPAGPVPMAPAPNPLTPAALAGILTGAMTVVVAMSVIGLNYHYRDYVTCVRDSLTTVGAENCDRYAPQWYVDFTGNTE